MPAAMHGAVAGRLVVIFGREGLGKNMVADQIVPDEKGVRADKIATHEVVAQFAAQPLEGLQAGAEVVTAVPDAIGAVARHPVQVGRQGGVVFHHHDPRPATVHRAPDVPGVLVDVERQEVELPRHAQIVEDAGDVFPRDKAAMRPQRAAAQLGPGRHGVEEGRVPVDPVPRPALGEQKRGVVFRAVSDSDFDKDAIRLAEAPEYFADHAVLAVLRADLGGETLQPFRIAVARVSFQLEVVPPDGLALAAGGGLPPQQVADFAQLADDGQAPVEGFEEAFHDSEKAGLHHPDPTRHSSARPVGISSMNREGFCTTWPLCALLQTIG